MASVMRPSSSWFPTMAPLDISRIFGEGVSILIHLRVIIPLSGIHFNITVLPYILPFSPLNYSKPPPLPFWNKTFYFYLSNRWMILMQNVNKHRIDFECYTLNDRIMVSKKSVLLTANFKILGNSEGYNSTTLANEDLSWKKRLPFFFKKVVCSCIAHFFMAYDCTLENNHAWCRL